MADVFYWISSNIPPITGRSESGANEMEELKPGKAPDFDTNTVRMDAEDFVPRQAAPSNCDIKQDSSDISSDSDDGEEDMTQPVAATARRVAVPAAPTVRRFGISILEQALYAGQPQDKGKQ